MSAQQECQYDEVDDHQSPVEAAISFARQGLAVFQLWGVIDGVCECRKGADCPDTGKHPRQGGWQKRATTKTAIIWRWWLKHPLANIGIACGPRSNLVVVDFDPKNGSATSLDALVKIHGDPFPHTAEHRSGSGVGTHLLYEYPKGLLVGNALPALKDWQGIDVRGEGGYIVAPPSAHKSGDCYQVVYDLSHRVGLPQWLTEDLHADDAYIERPPGFDTYVWGAVLDAFERIRCAPDGSVNTILNAESYSIGQLVSGDEVGAEIVATYLITAGLAADPIRPDKVEDTVTRAIARGQDKPRKVSSGFKNRAEALSALDKIRTAAVSAPFPGQAGSSQRRVLKAMVDMAEKAGGPSNFGAGTKRIAYESGLRSLNTVTRVLRELRRDGWLQRLTEGQHKEQPSTWRLRIPSSFTPSDSFYTPSDQGFSEVNNEGTLCLTAYGTVIHFGKPTSPSPPPVGHDAFRDPGRYSNLGRAIGGNGHAIYEHLLYLGQWTTKKEMAQKLGISLSTVYERLRRLVAHNLVEIDGPRVRAIPMDTEDFDRIAKRLGLYGMAKRQLRYYEQVYGWSSTDRPSGREHTANTDNTDDACMPDRAGRAPQVQIPMKETY